MGRRSNRWLAEHPRAARAISAGLIAATLPVAADDVLDHFQIDRRGVETLAPVERFDAQRDRRRPSLWRPDTLQVAYQDLEGRPWIEAVETRTELPRGATVAVRYDPEEPDEPRLARGAPFIGSRTVSTVMLLLLVPGGLYEVFGRHRFGLRRALAKAKRLGAVGPPGSHRVTVRFEQRLRLGQVPTHAYVASCSCGWHIAFWPKDDIWRLADAHAPPGTELVAATNG